MVLWMPKSGAPSEPPSSWVRKDIRPRTFTGDDPAEALAERALAGDEAAWNELVRRFERRVWVSLLALGAPPDVARDLSQDTWVRLWAKAKAGELTELKLPGLAVTQARFLWLSARRAETSGKVVVRLEEAADPGRDPESQAARAQEVARAVAAVEALPDRARSVFTAVYDEGLSAAEASSRFGISVQRVRQTLFEVRGRLRAVLGGA
jgi:RNA polymerase sigma-70 factor (ECF subfamily)